VKILAFGSLIWMVGFGCGRLNFHASLRRKRNTPKNTRLIVMNETSLSEKKHGEKIWESYLPLLSNWTLEYNKTMITISVAFLAGQLVLIRHPGLASPFCATLAIFPTVMSLLASLQTILTSRNCLYVIVRDAAQSSGAPELSEDPFRSEKLDWIEKMHHKTWWRLFLSMAIAMASFTTGAVLTLAAIAVPFFQNL